MTVLLVDDEPTIRKLIRLMLRSHGFQILEASSGAEALALAQDAPIDVLVTDIVMEDIDGVALAETVVKRHPNIRVVFISGRPMDFNAQRPQDFRSVFLRKPFQKGDLVNAILNLSATEVYNNGRVRLWRCPNCRWWREWETEKCIVCGFHRDDPAPPRQPDDLGC